jgi:uncharacterized membrane protein
MSNEEGYDELRSRAPSVRQRLQSLDTTPLAIAEATPEGRRQAVEEALAGLRNRNVRYTGNLQQRLEEWITARAAWSQNHGTSPVSTEQTLLQTDERLSLELLRIKRLSRPGITVLVVRGLFSSLWGVDNLQHREGSGVTEVRHISVRRDYNYGFYADEFPYRVQELMSYDTVILADVDVEALREFGRQALLSYLQNGGGLILLGGYYSFGLSTIYETELGALLPVRSKEFDLQPVRAELQPHRGSPFTAGLGWEHKPVSLWQHQVTVADKAFVHISAGGYPFLVTRAVGTARIAAITGSVLGTPTQGQMPFWQWKSWLDLLCRVVAWTASKS